MRAGRPRTDGIRPRPSYAVVAVGALVLAGISLLVLPRGVAYDPWSWLVWGREIVHGQLDTRSAATSIKPLPVLVDAVGALFGSKAAPVLWLLTARAAALAAVGLAYRLAARFAGPVAGVLAGLGIVTIAQYASYLFFAGMSEPMATATALLAADAAVSRRHRLAFAALLLTGLLRIEAWPIAIGYAAWRLWRDPSLRRLLAAGAGLALLPAAWFGLDWIGSGTPLRSTGAASHQSQGGPLLSPHPGLATVTETSHLLLAPLAVVGVVTWLWALARYRTDARARAFAWLGAGALTWLAVAAVMAQGRVATGAPRYLIPAAGVVAVIGAAGLARALAVLVRSPALAGAAALLIAVGGGILQIGHVAGHVSDEIPSNRQLVTVARTMQDAVRIAGGGPAMTRCGRVAADPFQVPLVVWTAQLHFVQVSGTPHPPGTVIQMAGLPQLPAGGGYREVGTAGSGATRLTVFQTCR